MNSIGCLALWLSLLVSAAYAAGSVHCGPNGTWSISDGSDAAMQAHANATYSGNVSAGMMQRYVFNMTTRARVQFTLRELAGGKSDCDMAVDLIPDSYTLLLCWDRSSISRRLPELQRTVSAFASLGTFSAFVYGYHNCTYNFSVSVFFDDLTGCPNDCSRRGNCQEDDPDVLSFTCNCSAGYIGSYCEQQVGLLEPESPVSGYVTPSADFWNYYPFYGSSDADSVFTITRANQWDWYDFYFKAGTPPTRYNGTGTRVALGGTKSVRTFLVNPGFRVLIADIAGI
jgi:hypothetical protein